METFKIYAFAQKSIRSHDIIQVWVPFFVQKTKSCRGRRSVCTGRRNRRWQSVKKDPLFGSLDHYSSMSCGSVRVPPTRWYCKYFISSYLRNESSSLKKGYDRSLSSNVSPPCHLHIDCATAHFRAILYICPVIYHIWTGPNDNRRISEMNPSTYDIATAENFR